MALPRRVATSLVTRTRQGTMARRVIKTARRRAGRVPMARSAATSLAGPRTAPRTGRTTAVPPKAGLRLTPPRLSSPAPPPRPLTGPPTPGLSPPPPGGPRPPGVRPSQPVAISLPEAVKAAHGEGFSFGESVGRDAPGLWLEAVLARKPRMPSDLEARLLQGSVLPIDSLLHDEVRHSLRRGFWEALESARR